jgi:hypothetical protein
MFRGLCHDVYDQAETSGHNLREPSKDPAVDVAKPWNETSVPRFETLLESCLQTTILNLTRWTYMLLECFPLPG